MPLLIFHVDGSIQAAILMAIYGKRVRASIPAFDDAVEFQWEDGQWKAEDSEPVEIQFDATPDEFNRRAQAAVREPVSPLDALEPGSWPACKAAVVSWVRVN
jgi:hypothetical protein